MKDECIAFGSMVLTGENQSSWSLEKVYIPAALCPHKSHMDWPQIKPRAPCSKISN